MKRKKVSELAKQIRGVSYKTEDLHENLDENSVTLLRANNIFEGRINFDDVVYVDKSRVAREQYLCKGDILVCASSGSKQLVGKAASFNFDTECTFGAFCKVVRPNQDVANYLSMYFQSNAYRRKISEVAIGANINNIRNEHIDALELPIGSNAENEKVVASFSLLQQIIDGRKQQLHKLDELIKSRFIELFGSISEEVPLSYYIAGLNAGKSLAGEEENHNKVLKTGAATYDYFDATQIKNLPIDYEPQESHRVKAGDVIISRMNTAELVGAAAYVWDVPEHIYLPDRLWRADVKETANPIFVWQVLIQSSTKESIRRIASGTSGSMKNISKLGLLGIRVVKAPINLQQQFAAFVEQTDKSKLAVQKGLQELEILKKSLMQQYFG